MKQGVVAEWEALIDEGIAAADRGDMVDGEAYMIEFIEWMKAVRNDENASIQIPPSVAKATNDDYSS